MLSVPEKIEKEGTDRFFDWLTESNEALAHFLKKSKDWKYCFGEDYDAEGNFIKILTPEEQKEKFFKFFSNSRIKKTQTSYGIFEPASFFSIKRYESTDLDHFLEAWFLIRKSLWFKKEHVSTWLKLLADAQGAVPLKKSEPPEALDTGRGPQVVNLDRVIEEYEYEAHTRKSGGDDEHAAGVSSMPVYTPQDIHQKLREVNGWGTPLDQSLSFMDLPHPLGIASMTGAQKSRSPEKRRVELLRFLCGPHVRLSSFMNPQEREAFYSSCSIAYGMYGRPLAFDSWLPFLQAFEALERKACAMHSKTGRMMLAYIRDHFLRARFIFSGETGVDQALDAHFATFLPWLCSADLIFKAQGTSFSLRLTEEQWENALKHASPDLLKAYEYYRVIKNHKTQPYSGILLFLWRWTQARLSASFEKEKSFHPVHDDLLMPMAVGLRWSQGQACTPEERRALQGAIEEIYQHHSAVRLFWNMGRYGRAITCCSLAVSTLGMMAWVIVLRHTQSFSLQKACLMGGAWWFIIMGLYLLGTCVWKIAQQKHWKHVLGGPDQRAVLDEETRSDDRGASMPPSSSGLQCSEEDLNRLEAILNAEDPDQARRPLASQL